MKGWHYESYRHYLAAKGVKTVQKRYRQRFPDLVKNFPGNNPDITDDYARFRQEPPSKYEPGSFRTKKIADDKLAVFGRNMKTKKYELQSILIERKKYFADKLKGGFADSKKPSDFDASELIKGTKHEMEHTSDPEIAQEIAMDHLQENEKYYSDLEKFESGKSKFLSDPRFYKLQYKELDI